MPSFLGHPRVNTVLLPAPVYATWNPAGTNPNITLSNGNLTAELTGSTPATAYGTSASSGFNFDNGKRYIEIIIDNISGFSSSIAFGFCDTNQVGGFELGDLEYAYACRADGNIESNGVVNSLGSSIGAGAVVQLAIHAYIEAGVAKANIWFGVNGTWLGSGDPVGGGNPAFAGAVAPLATDWAVRATMQTPGDRITAGFSPGAFVFSAPAGFTAGWGANLT
ncbi:hypothetical protein [Thalassobaculum sp.]|uniref:hypothetical protein n=1 Tax=Thalassobaculum sp. TaxID=2022740 RepID=UPI0032ED416A